MEQAALERKAVSVREAMRICGMGRNSFYSLLQSGKIRGLRVGKKWLVPLKAIDEFLQQQ
ncbi:MAG: helix-turn-helix domain-containing protein [Thermacetogeniaceae bacterium]|jgi:excisionase family DNA binding protein